MWREIKEAESESDVSGSCPALVMKEPVDLESLFAPFANVDDYASFPQKHTDAKWPTTNSLLTPLWSMPHVLIVTVYQNAVSLVVVSSPGS